MRFATHRARFKHIMLLRDLPHVSMDIKSSSMSFNKLCEKNYIWHDKNIFTVSLSIRFCMYVLN